MCGFAGFWEFKEQSSVFLQNTARAMSDKIRSRGPDSHGVWVEEKTGLALSHRRLSIIDLTDDGAQPMVSKSGRFVIAYNGELYNTSELKDELEAKGVFFKGHSDTEVLLEACAVYGVEKALQKANGMFGFALWDCVDKCIYLARDRIGIKPLYWGFNNGILFFGSTPGTFTVHPKWAPVIDADALSGFFQHNYFIGKSSIYKGIQKLLPGSFLKLDKSKTPIIENYWSLDEVIQKTSISSHTEKELEDELDSLLRDAVKAHMVADVPLGAFLSGGIDSSTVVAIMQSISQKPVKTFSIGFNEEGFNEAHYAKEVAKHLGTEHYEHYFDYDDALKLIPDIPNWYDEPFADSSQLPTYLVSKIAKEHVKVSLSGDGGDELFAGYNRYILFDTIRKKLNWLPYSFARMLAFGLGKLTPKQIEWSQQFIPKLKSQPQFADKVYKLAAILGVRKNDFYRNLVMLWPEHQDLVNNAHYDVLLPDPSTKMDFISEMQFKDTLTYLPDDILTKVDRASMAVSLEARVPLLDYRLVEFAWSLPQNLKIQSGKGKILLTNVLKRYVPNELIDRPKMGFGVPVGKWLCGPLQDWASELLYSDAAKDGLLNMEPIYKRWQEHQNGSRNWEAALWGVLMFLAWRVK